MNWTLTRRNKSDDYGIDFFKRDLANIFNDFFSITPTSLFDSQWLPTVDVEEDEKYIKVKAEIPGIEEKDLNVTLENNILTLSGEKREEKEETNKDKRYYYAERRFGSFSRSISLPEGIKQDKIKATFKKGVLSINIPKDESKSPNKINIEVQ